MRREDLILRNDARVASIILDAGEVSPKHYHSEVVETVICLEGQITVNQSSPIMTVNLIPGQSVTINPTIEHYLANNSDAQSTYLLIQDGNYDFVQSNS